MSERNKPCPCGSGLKFKHCCLGRVGQAREAIRQHATLKEIAWRGRLAGDVPDTAATFIPSERR